MELSNLRSQIDKIDDELVKLFSERMQLSKEIAAYKKAHNLPIHVPSREREILQQVAQKAGPDMEDYTRVLYSMLFELSRSYQSKCRSTHTPLFQTITNAIENTPKLFPQSPTVACQGAEGAHAQIACEIVFKNPFIMFFKNYKSVFQAIEQGLCQYGILPIENSTASSVKEIYDLIIRHNFSIIKTTEMNIDHNLLANPGAKLEEITEIYSHQNAINQCSGFLAKLPNVKIIPVDNTATAAKMVANSGKKNVAALSSQLCKTLYGLTSLVDYIQDKDTNKTRFICVSKNLEIYPGSDKTSIMMILPHTPGSLYKVLARLYALGINVLKLESRPNPKRDFSFMFYFDLETSIYSDEFIRLMSELDDLCEEFWYLGSYTEVV